MPILIRYHGTNGDNILSIISGHQMNPQRGRLFFAQNSPDSCFMHGADSKRKAAFVIKVEITVPEQTKEERAITMDQIFASILKSDTPMKVKVLEMYVRKAGDSRLEKISGESTIRSYLQNAR